jgi:hypothetical protein
MIPILGKLICKIRGRHKRGKPYDGALGTDRVFYFCPICGRITSYKRKPNVIPLKATG